MSRTANTRTRQHRWALSGMGALLLATSFLAIPAMAQEGLESLFDQAAKANTATSEENNALKAQLESEIDSRLKSIAATIGKETEMMDPATLTVEDLDRLQREAAQTASIQERRSAQHAAIREEIELLLFLQTSINEIEQARATQAAAAVGAVDASGAAIPGGQATVDVEALRAEWEAEKAAEAEQAAAAAAAAVDAQEKASIPRLAAIKGANGQWEAEIESVNGVMQYVTSGDALADGFVVESIDSKTVVIKSSGSGARYSLIPSPPMDATGGTSQARDMSTANGAGTF